MKARLILLALASLTALGCGGGGGGSGGGDEGNASTGVRVLNTAMDLPPISLTTTAKVGKTISTTKFAESTGFFELPEGDQTISLQTVDGGTGPFNFSVTIHDQDRPQVLIYGNREVFGVSATLLEAKKLEVPDGMAAVRIAHGVTGAASISGSVGVEELPAAVTVGTASKYLFVPAGDVLIRVSRSADSRILANQSVPVEAGKAYTFVLSGEIDYLVVSALLAD
jgi:hypothetical protein